MARTKTVTTKKKCCKDSPRCSSCPVVWMRLEKDGHAACCGRSKGAKATYTVSETMPKKAMKKARRR